SVHAVANARRPPSCSERNWLMMFAPVPCHFQTAAKPYSFDPAYVVDEALDALRASGMARQSIVQTDRHEFRMRFALAMEHIKGILQIGEEVACRAEPAAREAVVVVAERMWHDEMRLAADVYPIGQIVRVGGAIIEKTAFLCEQPAGVHAGRIAAIPAERAHSHRGGDGSNGSADFLALFGLRELIMLGETIAMRAHIPAGLTDGGGCFLVALERKRAAVDRERQIAAPKHIVETPESGPSAVFEHGFGS